MSLTRAQWAEMWESVKSIEFDAALLQSNVVKKSIMIEVNKIKEQIQSVIGQME